MTTVKEVPIKRKRYYSFRYRKKPTRVKKDLVCRTCKANIRYYSTNQVTCNNPECKRLWLAKRQRLWFEATRYKRYWKMYKWRAEKKQEQELKAKLKYQDLELPKL